MALSSAVETVSPYETSEHAAALRRWGEALDAPLATNFAAPFERFGKARVVLLGEATHGTSEFYRARAAITRALVERHGFNIVAVEADWPDADRLDRYVRKREKPASEQKAFERFPTWMWRNLEVREFIDWLHQHNAERPPAARVEFRGLDVYSLSNSIAAVLNYLDAIDPEQAKAARHRYGCLTPWQDDPAAYGRSALRGGDTCEDEAVAQLHALLEMRVEDMQSDGEGLFDAAQNARIVRAAEQYYRIMYRGSRDSWNLRDRHMFDTLQHVMQARGPGAKAVVWAHNSHIGNAAATSMGWQGEFNIGELCRGAYGDDAALIGLGTDRGTVAAASDWDGPVEIKTVLPARHDSYEHMFRRGGMARSLTDWWQRDDREDLVDILEQPRLERAIGVIYRPDTELMSHYFRAVLPEQFDAYVWFVETSAVTPLGTAEPEGPAETYPFGL
jgi:erythromycin esterase-like protein